MKVIFEETSNQSLHIVPTFFTIIFFSLRVVFSVNISSPFHRSYFLISPNFLFHRLSRLFLTLYLSFLLVLSLESTSRHFPYVLSQQTRSLFGILTTQLAFISFRHPSLSLMPYSSSFWQQYVYLLRFSSYSQYFETVSFSYFSRFPTFLSFSSLPSSLHLGGKGHFPTFFITTRS